MATYRRVYDSRHLQADCQEPGSAPEPYAYMKQLRAADCTFTNLLPKTKNTSRYRQHSMILCLK